MDFSLLYEMQKKLDSYIETKHELTNEALLERKLMAFHVELAELANETRCFKFWSEKSPSPDDVILEEYVDGIHFILSVGLEHGFDDQPIVPYLLEDKKTGEELVKYFYDVMEAVSSVRIQGDKESYNNLFSLYLRLGAALGFSESHITDAYMKKNEVNHERQNQGY